MKNLRLPIVITILFISSTMVFSIPFLLSAQQVGELPKIKEPPKFLGTYLNTMEGLIKWESMTLQHEKSTSTRDITSSPALADWSAPKVKNVSGQELSIVSYFAIASKDPENFKLYRLKTGKFKPSIVVSEEIKLSVIPIIDIPGLMGNMVQLVPDRILTKGNYILTEGDIKNDRTESCWGFTIDGGEKMWIEFSLSAWCSSFCFWR